MAGDGGERLCKAVRYRDRAMVALLLERGASVDAPDRCGRTPLWWAVNRGHATIVALLLEKGACMDEADKSVMNEHNTPLLWAINLGDNAIVALLLQKCAALGRVFV